MQNSDLRDRLNVTKKPKMAWSEERPKRQEQNETVQNCGRKSGNLRIFRLQLFALFLFPRFLISRVNEQSSVKG